MSDENPSLLKMLKKFYRITNSLLNQWQEDHPETEKIKFNIQISVDIDGYSYIYASKGNTNKIRR